MFISMAISSICSRFSEFVDDTVFSSIWRERSGPHWEGS
jgi:hypothetical protein